MFSEPEWIKLVMLLADTQEWIDSMGKDLFDKIPLQGKQTLRRKTYYLTIKALAHILEKHYYKIPRHPSAGKFHIPVPDILSHIRDAAHNTATPIPGSANFQRIHNTYQSIGFDNQGNPATCISIITDAGGHIITAFPITLTSNPTVTASQQQIENATTN